MHKDTLIMLVGLPRSGKTTKARDISSHAKDSIPIVCPDSIRLALHGQAYNFKAEGFVWAIAHVMVKSLFLAGHQTVILDACNNTRKRRDEWKSKDYQRRFISMDTVAAVCIDRARKYTREDLVEVIERMAAQHEPVTVDELTEEERTDE